MIYGGECAMIRARAGIKIVVSTKFENPRYGFGTRMTQMERIKIDFLLFDTLYGLSLQDCANDYIISMRSGTYWLLCAVVLERIPNYR